jgi:hypothetical protein
MREPTPENSNYYAKGIIFGPAIVCREKNICVYQQLMYLGELKVENALKLLVLDRFVDCLLLKFNCNGCSTLADRQDCSHRE